MTHEAGTTASPPGGFARTPTAQLFVWAVLAVAACSTMRVVSDYDRAVPFSSLHSFTMIVRPHPSTTDALVEQRTHDAIRAELTIKGFTYVMNPAEADFAVDFIIGASDRLDVRSYPSTHGAPSFVAGSGSQVDVNQYQEGSLAIDVFDARTRKPVWHGSAKKKLSESDVASSQAVIRDAVAAVLADFPPKER